MNPESVAIILEALFSLILFVLILVKVGLWWREPRIKPNGERQR
jgi:hypothetical protein